MGSQSAEKVPPLNIRVKAEQRRLIERAAKATHKSLSDFVRDTALREAENTLIDETAICLTDPAWAEFTAALDAPPEPNPRLRDLMSRKPVWEP